MTEIIKADKISGAEAAVFAVSVLPEVLRQNNLRCRYKYSFYGITIDIKKELATEWLREAETDAESEKIIHDVEKDGAGYFFEIGQTVESEAEDLRIMALNLIGKIPLLSDEELTGAYDEFMSKYLPYYGNGAVTFIYERYVSDELQKSISTRRDDFTEIISAVLRSDYRSFVMEDEAALLEIKNETDGKVRGKLVKDYLDSFFYLGANYLGAPKATRESVLKKADELQIKNAAQTEKRIDFELTPREQVIIDLLRATEKIRDLRKKTNLIGDYVMYRFLDEAVKRKAIDLSLAKRAYWAEFRDLIFDTDRMKIELAGRYFFTVAFYYGELWAKDGAWIREEKKELSQTEMTGMPAARGKATGRVSLILGPKDFGKFRDREILVTHMTRPEFLPVIRKAAAIVTDEGGLTCHAAVVAREFGIPCIIGTKNATQVLKDGDLVEVDAERGIVKLLNPQKNERNS